MVQQTDRLVIVDTETFGLDYAKDFIIELGFKIVDLDFNIIDDFHALVWDTAKYDRRFAALKKRADDGFKADFYIWNMHDRSGLWKDAREEGLSVDEVSANAITWLESHGIGIESTDDPMVGSSVQFDRMMLLNQMTGVHDHFHYRNIDTSSIKELCRRYNRRVYALLDEYAPKQELHRVLPDIDDTINEFKFYVDNFLWTSSMEDEPTNA